MAPSLLLELPAGDANRYLSWWTWAIGEDVAFRGLTTFGDWLFERADGSVHHLSILDASIERVCDSHRQLDAVLTHADAADRYLSSTFAQRAWRAGQRLQPGECFAFIVPPVLGGSFAVENIRPYPIGGYQLVMVQLTQLMRYVPEGTPGERVKMVFRDDQSMDLLVDGRSVRGF